MATYDLEHMTEGQFKDSLGSNIDNATQRQISTICNLTMCSAQRRASGL